MKTWIRNFPHNLALFFCLSSFTSRKYDNLTAKRFTLVQLVVLISFIIFRVDTLIVAFKNLKHQKYATPTKYYFFTHFVVFVGTFIFFSRTVLKRKEMFWAMKQLNSIANEISTNRIHRVKVKYNRCFKMFFALLYSSILVYHTVLYDALQVLGLVLNGQYPNNTSVRVISKIMSRPVRFWSSLVLYSYVLGGIVELEAS